MNPVGISCGSIPTPGPSQELPGLGLVFVLEHPLPLLVWGHRRAKLIIWLSKELQKSRETSKSAAQVPFQLSQALSALGLAGMIQKPMTNCLLGVLASLFLGRIHRASAWIWVSTCVFCGF